MKPIVTAFEASAQKSLAAGSDNEMIAVPHTEWHGNNLTADDLQAICTRNKWEFTTGQKPVAGADKTEPVYLIYREMDVAELSNEMARDIAYKTHAHITLAGHSANGGYGMVTLNARCKSESVILIQCPDGEILGWRVTGGILAMRREQAEKIKTIIESKL